MTLHLQKSVVYVTRDIERALGMEPSGGYFVISNDSIYARTIQKKYPKNVFLIKNEALLDTYDLLLLPEVKKRMNELKGDLIVFQNTSRIERLVKEEGWKLLNPSAKLSREIEEKVSQAKWLAEDASLLPPHKIVRAKELGFSGKKFVLQFNHSHTGHGTYIIESESMLTELKAKFPERECRVADFIDGPVFTVNALVSGKEPFVGNPSYQITGLAPFTDLPFSTIGNDFSLPLLPRYENAARDIKNIARSVGKKLALNGWKGLFGIDAIYEEETGRTYLLEINARQPASAVFESKLQKAASGDLSIFEAHIISLLGEDLASLPKKIDDGAQIVKRVTKRSFDADVESLERRGLEVISYDNESLNKELFRIQSTKGIMDSPGKLNSLGRFISSCFH